MAGISYDQEVLRLIDKFNELGIFVGSAVGYPCWSTCSRMPSVINRKMIDFVSPLPTVVIHHDMDHIISPEGMGKNDYIKNESQFNCRDCSWLGSGKLATCMSNMYQWPTGMARLCWVWNLPSMEPSPHHPLILVYEAATADLDDVNMIGSHSIYKLMEKTTVNYNRDIEIFPVLKRMLERILRISPYASNRHGVTWLR